MHIHLYTHIYTHTYIHIDTYSYTYTHTHTYTHIHIPIDTHRYTHIQTHSQIQDAYTHIDTYIHPHIYIPTHIHTCIQPHPHVHTYTTHTHIHRHTYTYIHPSTLILDILELHDSLTTSEIIFCWLPGHVGIKGNTAPISPMSIPYSDTKHAVSSYIKSLCHSSTFIICIILITLFCHVFHAFSFLIHTYS